MNGVNISFDSTNNFVELILNPSDFDDEINSNELFKFILEGPWAEVYISERAVKQSADKANHLFKTRDFEQVVTRVGERKNAEVEFKISDDMMSARLILTAPYGGRLPNLGAIRALANKNGIYRGISNKRIKSLLLQLKVATPGTVLEDTIAKGLPARDGRSSKLKPLVPNALERILKPQEDGDRVDMRNLGAIICVTPNAEVLRRMPPSAGRDGYDVKGNALTAISGEWQPINLGTGTTISAKDENLVISTISGMPKFQDLIMTVEDTFICSGVNVGSGHIEYDGAVLVNGDVTEKMQIKASGDVTINGFVESASVESGGDLIITEGAMGKVNDNQGNYNCTLVAKGSIHIQHGQGIEAHCNGNITIGRQLAYSKMVCAGSISVGKIDNPQGNIFACDLICQGNVIAGTVGAYSGSKMTIDFSPGLNALQEKRDSLEQLLDTLKANNERHKEKIEQLNQKLIPEPLLNKWNNIQELYSNENALVDWAENKLSELRNARLQYSDNIGLIATKRLYAGVSVKLNSRLWHSDREFDRCHVDFQDHQWIFEPIVHSN